MSSGFSPLFPGWSTTSWQSTQSSSGRSALLEDGKGEQERSSRDTRRKSWAPSGEEESRLMESLASLEEALNYCCQEAGINGWQLFWTCSTVSSVRQGYVGEVGAKLYCALTRSMNLNLGILDRWEKQLSVGMAAVKNWGLVSLTALGNLLWC